MEAKVRKLLARLEEVEALLGKPETVADQEQYKKLTQEHSYLSSIRDAAAPYFTAVKGIAENKELLQEETDPDLKAMIQEDLSTLQEALPEYIDKLETLLVPPDPRDNANVIVELRAGTGGDEAALFVGDCVRMYKLYADRRKWNMETLAATQSDAGGYKEYVMVISGACAFRYMQYEAGTHRVQRVPATETQGRVHTSAITVAVLPEPEEAEAIDIDEADLKIDTYRASGAGGQHVNTTDSAVRITHIPTGTVVYCQEERSQHKNKDKAMRLLGAKIAEEEEKKRNKERADMRSSQVGSGDRSERIRTYNFPQNRVTDHRIETTLYNLDHVMEGELEAFSEALVKHFYTLRLTDENS